MSANACDVLIRGGGLAGWSAALHLTAPGIAEPAPRVVVDVGDGLPGASALGSGAILGALNPDSRALAARYSPQLLATLESICRDAVTELERAVAALAIECCFVRSSSTRRFTDDRGEVRVEGDAACDLGALRDGLRREAMRRGVRLVEGEREARDVEPLRTVLATGAWLPRSDDWSREIAVPARVQRIEARAPSIEPRIVTLGPGFAVLRAGADGRIVATEGAEPSNRGDPFDAAPEQVGQERLEEFVRSCLAPGAELAITDRRAFPALHTCDGLPLVGPHPMRESTLLCAGFNGADATLAFSAGRVVAEWILFGKPRADAWTAFSPRRML